MKRVAIDLDEVLVSFVKPMAKFRGYKMPTTKKYQYVYKDQLWSQLLETNKSYLHLVV